MLSVERTVTEDWWTVPNRWVAVQSNIAEGATPTEGAGVYTFVNSTDGPTSVQSRNGRIVTRFLSIDTADQMSLVAQAQVSIDADMRLPSTIQVSTSPNPLHWHFDRMVVSDPDIGPPMDVVGTQWTYQLRGGPMTHSWTVL